jgi:hypothetical protein
MERKAIVDHANDIVAPVRNMVERDDPDGFQDWLDAVVNRVQLVVSQAKAEAAVELVNDRLASMTVKGDDDGS